MTKNPAEIAGTRYKDEKLMSRVQKTDGTSRCFAQIVNIKRQSLEYDYPTFHLSMKCYACTFAGGSPHLLEHEAAKWLTSTQLNSVDWLPADVTLIPKIAKKLNG